jgi:hypothetical protein
MMSQGFAPGYTQAELEEIEEMMAPWGKIWLKKLRMRSSP